jgi:hypothetical protein
MRDGGCVVNDADDGLCWVDEVVEEFLDIFELSIKDPFQCLNLLPGHLECIVPAKG